jgi:hypothetical protein
VLGNWKEKGIVPSDEQMELLLKHGLFFSDLSIKMSKIGV